MSEEIIINGIDVADCEYLTPVLHNCKIKNVNDKSYRPCRFYGVCPYKKLQIARQENHKLKEKFSAALKNNSSKTILSLENADLIAKNKELEDKTLDFAQRIYDLRTTLSEIKFVCIAYLKYSESEENKGGYIDIKNNIEGIEKKNAKLQDDTMKYLTRLLEESK